MNSAEFTTPNHNDALVNAHDENADAAMAGSDKPVSESESAPSDAMKDSPSEAHDARATHLAESLEPTMDSIQTSTPLIPTFTWLKKSIHRLFAFGFGSGLIKSAPGTWGTLMAWALWFPLSALISNDIWMAVFLCLAYVYGVFICQKVTQDMGVADHGGVVWDEIVAFWLILFVISPLTLMWQAIAFGVFRFFDIVKPWPIAFFDERLKNGFGVMWDDIIAALYSLFVIAVLVRIVEI